MNRRTPSRLAAAGRWFGLAGLAGLAVGTAPALPAAAAPLPADPLQRECWLSHTRERTRVNLREPTGVDFANLSRRQRVRSPFNLRFGVDGWGVCAAGLQAERTGRFVLALRQGEQLLRRVDLSNGATQAHVALPDGVHALTLRFVGGAAGRDLLPADEATLLIFGQDRL